MQLGQDKSQTGRSLISLLRKVSEIPASSHLVDGNDAGVLVHGQNRPGHVRTGGVGVGAGERRVDE